MKNWGITSLVALALTAGLCSIHADTIIWNGANSGNWSVGANWNPSHAPGSSDIAVITNSGNYTVTLDVSTNVGGLVLGATDGSTQTLFFNGQTFTLNGQVTVSSNGLFNLSSGTFIGGTNNTGGAVFNGTLICSGGSLAGSLTMASNSILSLTGTAALNAFNGLTLLTNYGTVIWSATDLHVTGNLQIFNYGLWDAQTNNTFYGGSGGGTTTFNNYGTFRKSGGTTFDSGIETQLDSNTTFNNYGTLENQAGRPSQGALLELINGNCTSSGTFNNTYPSTTECFGGCVLTGNSTFTGNGWVNGNFTGNNALVQGVWATDRSTLSGTLTITSNTVLNLITPTFPGGMVTLQSTVLTNYGMVLWTCDDLRCQSNPQIYNYGLWDDQTNNTLSGAVFNNYGTFRKSGGTLNDSPSVTTIDINTTFNNYGTLDVQSGFLDLLGGGMGNGIFNNATNNTATELGATIVYVLTGNPSFTGGGSISGNMTGSNAVVHGTLTTSYSTLSGTLTIASNAVVTLSWIPSQPVLLQGTILTNFGTVVLNNGNLNCQSSPQIYNYGLWDDQTNNTIYGAYNSSGTTTFNNYGTFRKSGGAGGNTVLDNNTTFNNLGTIDVQTGLLNLNGNYTLAGGALNFGINSSSDYGSISLAGTAALAGTLSVNLNNNYSPVAGSSFAVLGYGSETGIFTTTSLPHLSGLTWQNNYGATMFTLSVMSLPPMQLSSVTTLNGSSISFSWGTFDGQTYQVQCTTNLSPANWINLGNPIPGTNGTTTVSDVFGSSPQKFYRVVLPP